MFRGRVSGPASLMMEMLDVAVPMGWPVWRSGRPGTRSTEEAVWLPV